MNVIPILSFIPLQKELVWGGRKLKTHLGKTLPNDSSYGESWEIVDLPDNQSIVTGGPLDGQYLGSLLKEHPDALLGNSSMLDGHFPLLAKFIDAKQTLSVQVHPDEAACAAIQNGARPKTEAWYIIDREPGAKLYAGLKPEVDSARLKSAIQDGTIEDLLNVIDVTPGDFVFLPAGTIHAIGGGILLAEIQQSSNTTYRVFDWNRPGLDGHPRALHIDEALKATNYSQVGTPRIIPPTSGRPGVRCPFFEMELIRLVPDISVTLEGGGPIILMGVDGEGTATIRTSNATSAIQKGYTRFIPSAIASNVSLDTSAPLNVLSVRIPS